MPYYSVSKLNFLYDNSTEKETRFKNQCKIIIKWKSKKLTALDLLGLTENFTEQTLKAAKMKLFLHFHPDRNKNSTYSTRAFTILTDAVNYLASKLDSSIDIRNNPFLATKKTGISGRKGQKKPTVVPDPVKKEVPDSAEKKAYLARLIKINESKIMTSADEHFFREALAVHSEYLILQANNRNLLHLVLQKGGSSGFFQWLITQRYAEEAVSAVMPEGREDVFSIAFNFFRRDCLQILFDAYGMENFQSSSIEYELYLSILISEEEPEAFKTFWFLMDNLNYIPKCNQLAISVLDTALSEVDLPTFTRIYNKFKHLLLETDQCFTHNYLLINKVLKSTNFEIKLKKMADAGLLTQLTEPLFEIGGDWNSFLRQENAPEIIQHLQTKHKLLKSSITFSTEIINKLTKESLIVLLDIKLITVQQVLESSWFTSIENNPLLEEALLKKDKPTFYAWLKRVEFTPEYVKSTSGQSCLRLMLKYGIALTEQQLNIVHSTFDTYFTELAGKSVVFTEHDYYWLPTTAEAWLPSVIECIGKSPNRMASLNKVYAHEVRVVVRGNPTFLTIDPTVPYEYSETIISSFTPLQFFIATNKIPLAVLLLSHGVDGQQPVNFITQTGIKYPDSHSVRIISTNPGNRVKEDIENSKEIIFIHNNDRVEIGFSEDIFELYNQKVVTEAPHIVEAVKQAAPCGQITGKANLDAIEKYLQGIGAYGYSFKHTQSTVLDLRKSEIEKERNLYKVLTSDMISELKGKRLDAVVKQIQLNEAQSYLYKRTLDDDYKTKLSFFGSFTILHFGFSKQEKITAVRALIDFLQKGTPIPSSCKPALSQGDLAKIAALADIVFESEQPSPKERNL